MLNIPQILHKQIARAKRIVQSMLVTVQHEALTGRDAFGPTFSSPEDVEVILEFTSESVTLSDGTETASRAKITLLEPRPVTDQDKWTIPDGIGGYITENTLMVKTLMDPEESPYFAEIVLGDVKR
jgi:hypothetical protein